MTAVFGVVNDQEQAALAVDRFQDEGFGRGEISIIAPEVPDEKAVEGNEVRTSALAQGTLTGAAAGAILGGTLGWFTGWGGMMFPGVGAFIAAGPWLVGLAGAIVGSAIAAAIAGLVSAGLFRNDAKPIERALDPGHVLVGVQTHNDEEVHTARKVFAKLDASEVTTNENVAGSREGSKTR